MKKNRHDGYDVRREEEDNRKYKDLFKPDSHIDEFSSYCVERLKNENDPEEAKKLFTDWVTGLIELYSRSNK